MLVVEAPLCDGRAGQLGEVLRGAHVVWMEVRDDDPGHGARKLVELRRPALLRVGEAEPGVDERPTVVAGQEVRVDVPRTRRQRERDAPDASRQLVHPSTLRAARDPEGTVRSGHLDSETVSGTDRRPPPPWQPAIAACVGEPRAADAAVLDEACNRSNVSHKNS